MWYNFSFLRRTVLFLFVFIPFWSAAQTAQKCGFSRLAESVMSQRPDYADTLELVRNGDRGNGRSASKTTLSTEATIPVVFHIVLTKTQFDFLGGTEGVERRIDSQLVVINRDFAGTNYDRSAIPSAFQSVFGNSNIRFALAHTAPDGSATPGYEVTFTSRQGFEVDFGTGSGFGFSGAKYTSSGGAAAWDPYSYLNIWVINPLENGTASNIVGLAVPPYFTRGNGGLPLQEEGLVLHHRGFGKRTFLGESFVDGSDGGRTLTHELGHYFGLLHIWGDDDGLCPGSGGMDDGISDTPPQAYSSSDCPQFPEYDACSPDGNGIMFMNYMDYIDDACALMFTDEQVARMHRYVVSGGDAYGLTQHPWLLEYPPGTMYDPNGYTVYPNPADDQVNIVFRHPATGLKSIRVIDIMGRVLAVKEFDFSAAFYSFPTGGLNAGVYFIALDFTDTTEVHKVLVR